MPSNRPEDYYGTSGSRSGAAGSSAQTVSRRNRNLRIFIPILAVVAVLLIAAIAAIVWMNTTLKPFADYDLIMPNVYIDGIDVGGMTRTDAIKALKGDVHPAEAVTVTVSLPDRQLQFTMDSDDITLDINEAVTTAYYYGRGTGSLSAYQAYRAYNTARKTRKDIDVSESRTLNTDDIRSQIDAAAEDISQTLTETSVGYDQESGTITVVVGTPGISLDAELLYQKVCNAFYQGSDQTLTFDYEITYPAAVSLEEYYALMTVEPVNASYTPATAEVTAGTVGREPEITLEEAEQKLAAASPGEVLTFRSVEVQPEVQTEALESMLFRDTIAAYASPYDQSNSGRTENLRLACAAINGTVVLPGETFSFNDTVGERTAEKGYQKATVYVSGNSVAELGGGVCQVASTIYYCCMYADLDIVEREPHMYFVTYVPGGLDATVYWGQVDYKFRNSTDYPIRINAWLEGGKCWIELVGTASGNYAVINTVCTATNPFTTIYKDGTEENVSGYTGYTYEVTRYIYDSNDNLIRTDTPESLGSLGVSKYSRRDKIIYSGVAATTTPTATPAPTATPTPTPEPSPSAEPTPATSPEAVGAE